jgi:hypothetical protein
VPGHLLSQSYAAVLVCAQKNGWDREQHFETKVPALACPDFREPVIFMIYAFPRLFNLQVLPSVHE